MRYVVVCYVLVRYVEAGEAMYGELRYVVVRHVMAGAVRFVGVWSGKARQVGFVSFG